MRARVRVRAAWWPVRIGSSRRERSSVLRCTWYSFLLISGSREAGYLHSAPDRSILRSYLDEPRVLAHREGDVKRLEQRGLHSIEPLLDRSYFQTLMPCYDRFLRVLVELLIAGQSVRWHPVGPLGRLDVDELWRLRQRCIDRGCKRVHPLWPCRQFHKERAAASRTEGGARTIRLFVPGGRDVSYHAQCRRIREDVDRCSRPACELATPPAIADAVWIGCVGGNGESNRSAFARSFQFQSTDLSGMYIRLWLEYIHRQHAPQNTNQNKMIHHGCGVSHHGTCGRVLVGHLKRFAWHLNGECRKRPGTVHRSAQWIMDGIPRSLNEYLSGAATRGLDPVRQPLHALSALAHWRGGQSRTSRDG